MKNSRDLADLRPPVRARAAAFVAACKAQGIDVLIYCTLRDNEAQAVLYAQGRTTPGRIVTDAKPGESWHNYGCAFDWVPTIAGKPMWDSAPLYARCGAIAESVGLEWAGRWKSFREMAHCQYTGGLTLADVKKGKEVK